MSVGTFYFPQVFTPQGCYLNTMPVKRDLSDMHKAERWVLHMVQRTLSGVCAPPDDLWFSYDI